MSNNENDHTSQVPVVSQSANLAPIERKPTRLSVGSIPTIDSSSPNSPANRRKRRKGEEDPEAKVPLENLPEDQDFLADDAVMEFKTQKIQVMAFEPESPAVSQAKATSSQNSQTSGESGESPENESEKDSSTAQEKSTTTEKEESQTLTPASNQSQTVSQEKVQRRVRKERKAMPRQSNDELDIPLGNNKASSAIPIQPLRQNQPRPLVNKEERQAAAAASKPKKQASRISQSSQYASESAEDVRANIDQSLRQKGPYASSDKLPMVKKKKKKKTKSKLRPASVLLLVACALLLVGGAWGGYQFLWKPYSEEQERLRQESLAVESSMAQQQQYNEVISRIQHTTSVNGISEDVLNHLKTVAMSSYLLNPTTNEITRDEAQIPASDQALYFLDNLGQFDNDILLFYLANTERFEFVKAYPNRAELQTAPATLEESLESVPALLQWDTRWGYEPYADSTVYYAGCAPTSLSMVLSYLKKDPSLTPAVIKTYSEENGYFVSGAGTSNQLLVDYPDLQGVVVENLWADQESISQALQEGKVLIMNMAPGLFTQTGHFIVVAGEENGQMRILDPNSISRSRLWSYEEVLPETLAVWAYSNG